MNQSLEEQFINRALQKRLMTRSQTDSLRRELARLSKQGQAARIDTVAVQAGFLDIASARSIVGELAPPAQGQEDYAAWADPKGKLQKIADETGIPTGTPPPPAEPLQMELPPPVQRSGDSVFSESEAISELAEGDPTESTKIAFMPGDSSAAIVVDAEPDMDRGFTLPPLPAEKPKKKGTDVQTRQVPLPQPPKKERRPSEIVEEEPNFDQGFTMPPPVDEDETSHRRESEDETNRIKKEQTREPAPPAAAKPADDFTLGPPLPADHEDHTAKAAANEKAKVTTAGTKTTADGKAKKPQTERQSFDTTDLEKMGSVIDSSEMTIAQLRTQMQITSNVDVGGGSNKGATAVSQLSKQTQSARKRYVVIREIARGGMGKVLEVEDTDLRRSVALKVLRKELVDRRDLVERFLEEAQITGQLEHPNIVPVHEIGIDGKGNLYFTMKLVEGWGLNDILAKLRSGDKDSLREWTMPRLLEMFLKLCEGIAFAHSRGVIHRDLKPANIMVGRFGEVQIMDWGVAKIVSRSDKDAHEKAVISDRMENTFGATMVGAIVGTPSYMSPEQARGETDALGVESDIFALGVILYELLSLRSPWTGKTSDEVLEQVRTYNPEPPSRRNLDRAIAPELDDLSLRCLEKDREKRVATVRELMVNIRNHMEGRTMAAVHYSFAQLISKWMARNKRAIITLVLVIVALAGGAAATMFYLKQQELELVPGLMTEAKAAQDNWKAAQASGAFDKAKDYLLTARTRYEQVLKIDPDNEEAQKQSEIVSEDLSKVVLAEYDFKQREVHRERFSKRFAEAKDLFAHAKTEEKQGLKLSASEAKLQQALVILDVLLDDDSANAEVRVLKAQVAIFFSQRALAEKLVGLASYLYAIAKSTGEMKAEVDRLEAEIATAKARGG